MQWPSAHTKRLEEMSCSSQKDLLAVQYSQADAVESQN